MRILVGSTIPAFKMNDAGHWWWWLFAAERMAREAARAGIEVDWLAVCQQDGRGREPFTPLVKRLSLLRRSSVRWFSLDTGEDEITGSSRLVAICTGRNLITEHAMRHGHHAVYFADADIQAPDDVLPRLTELCWPVAGAHVPMYELDGPHAMDWAAIQSRTCEGIENAARYGDVRVHWNTAGSLLMTREAFRRVPWRYDLDLGETDDPATQRELARLGWPTLVRHDVICRHRPESINGVGERGHDLTVYR